MWLLCGLAVPVASWGGDPPGQADKPTPEEIPSVLTRHLQKIKGAELGSLSKVNTDSLQATFPKAQFFSLIFRKYPSEVVPPPPLKSNNVFVVQDDKVIHIPTESDLTKFFVANFPAKPDAEKVKAGTESWLRLASSLHQDRRPLYKFADPAIRVGDTEAHGKLAVRPESGRGELHVVLKFKNGKLVDVVSSGELAPARPTR